MLEIDAVGLTYGTGAASFTVLKDLSFTVGDGEFVSVVGPSGSGKTTLLRCLSGLLPVTTGAVRLQGTKVTGPPTSMALVFQDYSRSLMPWLTVRRNVEFPLKSSKPRRRDADAAVERAINAVGLTTAVNKYPWQLSGGMQQRVAIARALAYQPSVLVMDEPFASVDAQTRFELEDLLLSIRREFQMTVVFVTHDIDEAVYLSDRVVVMGGKPTTAKETLAIDLPDARQQDRTKDMPRFAHLRTELYRMLRESPSTASIATPVNSQ
jgi:NitT/TauT family transport system ATP-binding protein